MLELTKDRPVIPVIEINDAGNAVQLAHALLAGGIDVIEVTFRTDAAASAISAIRENVPEMLVGAGTVVNKDQIRPSFPAFPLRPRSKKGCRLDVRR